MSSLVDNIPLTTMMLKIIASINENPKVKVPLLSLVLSLAFAGGFGGVIKMYAQLIKSILDLF